MTTTPTLLVELAVLAAVTLWVLHGVGRAAVQYVRTGAVVSGSGQRMMLRGLAAVAAYAIVSVIQ